MELAGKSPIRPLCGLLFQNLRLQGKKKVKVSLFRTTRIFKTLSKFLVTRTPRQCRSHFQKIMTKFKNLKKVKAFYQE